MVFFHWLVTCNYLNRWLFSSVAGFWPKKWPHFLYAVDVHCFLLCWSLRTLCWRLIQPRIKTTPLGMLLLFHRLYQSPSGSPSCCLVRKTSTVVLYLGPVHRRSSYQHCHCFWLRWRHRRQKTVPRAKCFEDRTLYNPPSSPVVVEHRERWQQI